MIEAPDIKSLRRTWIEELEPALRRGDEGQSICEQLSDRWDELLSQVYFEHLGKHRSDCALYALGGYGRREMAPFSDLDIMVLIGSEEDRELLERVEGFIRYLWTTGIKIGHSVRTPEQCQTLAAEDTVVATSLLDARIIAGRADIHPDLTGTVRQFLLEGGVATFIRLVREGVSHRHKKFGASAYLLEPQLKQGQGGLRDLHALYWTADLLFGSHYSVDLVRRGVVGDNEARRLEAAHSFLLRTRFAQHLYHGWKQDQLTYAAQGPVAAMMGFGEEHVGDSLSRFMQAYYLHARDVASISDLWLEEWTIAQSATDIVPPTFNEQWLVLDRPELLADDPDAVFDLLDRARRQRLRLHPSVRRALSEAGPLLPNSVALRDEPKQVIREIICDLDSPHQIFQTVANTGILAKVLPEWAHLAGQAQHDTYHIFTTDVHLLATCKRMKEILRGDVEKRSPYLAGVAHRYCNRHHPDALVLAALLHDVGKGLGADHSVIGAGMAAEVAYRLGLDSDEQKLIRQLILEHLTMPKVSQRRDIGDPATLRAFVGNVSDPDVLDALTLLSFVDMDSVGPGHLNDWKLNLLEELHRAAKAFLRETRSGSYSAVYESLALIRELLEGELSRERTDDLIGILPKRLVETFRVPRLIRCVRLLADSTDSSQVSFHNASDGSSTEVLVFEPVHPGRLAEIAGVLDAGGLDIRTAASYPLGNGGTLDVFEVQTADVDHFAIPERRQSAIASQINDVISGQQLFEEILREKLRQSRLPPRKRPHIEPSVVIDNAFDPNFSIIEVKAPDAPGLLALLAGTLRDLELLVDRSIITTEGDRAIDTFYVASASGQKLDEADIPIARQSILRVLEEFTTGQGG